jgi:hypothetical protein
MHTSKGIEKRDATYFVECSCGWRTSEIRRETVVIRLNKHVKGASK